MKAGKGQAAFNMLKNTPKGPMSTANEPTGFEIGLAHHQRGELEQAAAAYRATLSRAPKHFDALHLLGVVALQQAHVALGVELITKALKINPSSSSAHMNLGNAMQTLGRHGEALASYDRAIALQPSLVDAHSNRAATLVDLYRYDDALGSCDFALKISPNHARALCNRGNALRGLDRPSEALRSFDQALDIEPALAEAHNNRGVLLTDLDQLTEALACHDRALRINPNYIDALGNRAEILQRLKRHQEAANAYANLLSIRADYPYAVGRKLHSQLQVCDWSDYAQNVAQVTSAVLQGKLADTPGFLFAATDNAAAQLQCARTYSANRHPPAPIPLWRGERHHHPRIRLSYLSADFHNHATAHLLSEVLELHDTTRFELSAISFGPDDGSVMRKRLECAFESFSDVRGRSDLAVARMLYERQTDIAVDLKGFTNGGRPGILAYRPAPIQVSYLGYPGTSGADYIDYILADERVAPPQHEVYYAEKVVRLPDSYQANDSKRELATRVPSRADVSLPETGFVFCSFNNNYKITPPVFDIWMRLLQRVPGSVLWLLEDNATASHNLRLEAAQRGVTPERIVFAPRVSVQDHLARQRVADLFLDTLPVNAHTTASDALFVGLPVLTCTGNAFASRVAASLLHAIGLPELICSNLADYEQLALRLATVPDALANLKSRLAHNRETYPLFDAQRLCRHIEDAYLTMYQRHQMGLPPQSFCVPARKA